MAISLATLVSSSQGPKGALTSSSEGERRSGSDAGQARDKHGTGAGRARAIIDSAKEEFGVGGSGRAGRYNNH